jgi:thiol-disulfide isomerase/thioredoxin
MRAMRLVLVICILSLGSAATASPATFTESDFRGTLGVTEQVRLSYRGVDCQALSFDEFAEAMLVKGARSDVERALDGTAVTVTIRKAGAEVCPSPYPPISQMPPFELRDLAGRAATAESLKGKPTLINFYFADCKPCILEVGPLNRFAADRPDMNFLAVTFDESETARAFVARYKFKWRVVPGAREFIDRMRVKQYPTLALFDGTGRLLGTRRGGVRDELEAATVAPQLKRWVDSLLRSSKATPR